MDIVSPEIGSARLDGPAEPPVGTVLRRYRRASRPHHRAGETEARQESAWQGVESRGEVRARISAAANRPYRKLATGIGMLPASCSRGVKRMEAPAAAKIA
jgi:hypothetical protein